GPSPLVAVVGVMGARVQGKSFVGGRPKAVGIGMRIPAYLGTEVGVLLELLTVHPSFPTWRGKPVAGLVWQALTSAGGAPVLGLSPIPAVLPSAPDAPVSPAPTDRLARSRPVVRRHGAGIVPHLSAAPGPLG